MIAKNWWDKFLDLSSNADVEDKRRRLLFYVASYAGGSIILLFAMQHIGSVDISLQAVLFGGALLTLSNVVCSHFFDYKEFFYAIAGLLIGGFMIALVVTGGYNNTGLFWVYPFPVAAFILLGYRTGLLINFVLYAVIVYLLTNQHLIRAEYSDDQVSRFLASLFTTILLALIGEFFRYRSQVELSEISSERQRQANTDPLTQLPNRRFLEAVYLPRLHGQEEQSFPVTCVVIDIDHFKQVNDNYGHDIGDNVLKHVAHLLTQNIRQTDVAVRTGGEEFLVIFPKAELSIGHKLSEKLRKTIEVSPFIMEGNTLDITCSFGVSTALTSDEINAAFKQADDKLYQAKRAGRNCVC